jgi:hypothetical protein
MSKRLFLRAAGAMAAGAALQACGGGGGGGGGGSGSSGGTCSANATPAPGGTLTLLQRLQQDANLSLFARAVTAANLTGRYSDPSAGLTLFAADNAAMNLLATRLGFADGNALVSGLSGDQWAAIVSYATVPQALSRGTLDSYACNNTRPDTLWAFEGTPQPLIFTFENNEFFVWDGIGRVSITHAQNDLGASNGVLHVLSAPVLPRGVLTVAQMLRASVDAFQSFAERMVATGVAAQLNGAGPFTVFAPGFVQASSLDATGVRRHVSSGRLDGDDFTTLNLTSLANTTLSLRSGTPPTLAGNGVTARVVDVDFWGSNGVIHTIDAVL